jgi:basic membrane protein A
MAGRRRPVATLALVTTLALVAVLGAAGCSTHASYRDEPGGMRIGVAYDPGGPTDGLVNQSVRDGVYRYAAGAHGSVGVIKELVAVADESVEDRYDRLVILCESGYDPVIVVGGWYAWDGDSPLTRAAKACPQTRFAVVNDSGVSAANVADLVFDDVQGAYLMGVAAALASKTHKVGMVGACPTDPVSTLATGYQAGADAGHSGTEVSVGYLSDDPGSCPDLTYSGTAAQRVAAALYGSGVDVVYQAVGPSGVGVFEAAQEQDKLAIGMGSDQYRSAGPALRGAILTSQVNRCDIVVANLLADYAKGEFHSGVSRYGVAQGAIQYATSGTRVRPLEPTLERYRKGIADGSVTVPGSQ